MDPRNIIDPFHRALYAVIAEKLQLRREQLEVGTPGDFAAYKHEVGYIAALRDVLSWAEDVERDRYGRKPDTEG